MKTGQGGRLRARLRGSRVPVLALAASIAGTVGAQAQDQGGSAAANPATVPAAPASRRGPGIEEVVVTAQRRSQSVQKTALTIAVIPPKALANAGITSALQLTSVAPSVQIGNSGPTPSVYIRGVGGYSSTAAQSPAVPFYIDGVYAARSQSVVSEFYDVDRLEIVKGPQGTLYGRNATGGAINIITANPRLGEFSGYANAEFGNYSSESGDFAINVPISPTVAARLSAQIVNKGGYTSEDFGDDRHESARLKVLWQINNDQTLLIDGSYGHEGGKGSANVALNQDIPGWYPWLDITDPRSQAYQIQHGAAPLPGFVRPDVPSDGSQNLNFYNISAQYNWNFGPATLTILPAYRYSKMQYGVPFSFFYSNGLGLGTQPASPETSSATSVEARLSGNSDVLKWVAGLYYYNEDQSQQYTINAGFPEDLGVLAKFGTKSYAAFGQATYSVTKHIRLIGGLRFTSDQRSITDGQSYVISPTLFLGPPPVAGLACAFPFPTQSQCEVDSYAGTKTFTNLSFKGGAEADVFDNSLLYATISRGFKAGGFNTQSVIGSPGEALVFKPETLTAYEAGIKNRFLNNRLQVNVSGFYWDYKDHQEPRVGFTNAGLINLVYYNAGSEVVFGGDLDVVARPWTGGTITTSVEYANSNYPNFKYQTPSSTFNPASTACIGLPSTSQPGFTTVDCSGFEALKTPKFSGNVSVAQAFELAYGRLIANANMTFASSRWLAVDFTPIERAGSYATLDASLTFEAPSGHWSVTGFVRNVNDGRVYTQADENALSTIVQANINAPRTYGARLSYNF